MRCTRTLLREHCTRARIVFHYVASEYNPSFVSLKCWFQLRVLEMTHIHQRSKMDRSLLFVCFQDDLLLALRFGHWPSQQLFELLPFLVHCCFCIQDFHRMEQNCNDPMSLNPSLQCDLRDLWVESFLTAFSWIHELLRCMHALILGFHWIRYKFHLCWNVVGLQCTAASIRSSNYLLAFYHRFLELLINRINRCLSTSAHCRASDSRWSIAASLFVKLLLPYWTKFLAMMIRPCRCLHLFSAAPWTTCTRLEDLHLMLSTA